VRLSARLLTFVLLGLCVAQVRLAAQSKRAADGKDEWTAITGATVLPVSGPMIRRGTIVWKNGKIEAVGSEIDVPDGATVHDADGKYVCPGFVAIAVAGIGVESASGDIRHGLDPYDLELRIALANGITTAHIVQSRGGSGFGQDGPLSSGSSSAVIKLTRGDLGAMFVKEPVFNYFSLPSRQLPINLYELRERFKRAKKHLEDVELAKFEKKKPPKLPRDIATYVTILRNERPTVFSVRNNAEVRLVLELRATYGFDVVLYEPNDAWQIGSRLAGASVPVWVKSRGRDFDFSLDQPVLGEGDMVPVRRPAAFVRTGVRTTVLPYRRGVSLSGIAGRDLSTLAMDAAFAVRGGLSEADALRAITLNPATDLGIANRVGSLDKGKDADVLILSGHPLDYRAWVLKAFINGKPYYDRAESRLYRHVPIRNEKE